MKNSYFLLGAENTLRTLKSLFICIICFLFLACGDSPFGNDSDSNEEGLTEFSSLGVSLTSKDYIYTIYWNEKPKKFNRSSALMVVTDHDNQPIDLKGKLDVTLDMPDMSHSNNKPQVEARSASTPEGVYEVSQFLFIMSGLWEITIREQISDGSFTNEVKLRLSLE